MVEREGLHNRLEIKLDGKKAAESERNLAAAKGSGEEHNLENKKDSEEEHNLEAEKGSEEVRKLDVEKKLDAKHAVYTLKDLMDLVAALRAKDGCPWDQAQTHGSMKNCMLNEAQEVVEGIERYETTGESDNLCEELGDVLFQVAFHSQIAMEEGIFTIDDVLECICKKMIRRHPHVFGPGKGGPVPDWEEIKRKERERKKIEKQNP